MHDFVVNKKCILHIYFFSRNVILHMIFFFSKHQEYEQKLLENYMNQQNSANNHVIPTSSKPIPTR